jgi:putative DNA primase/helicase
MQADVITREGALSSSFGATSADWEAWQRLAGSDLLPVVMDPAAKISAKSKLSDLGKSPSRYDQQGEVVGMPGWTSHIATDRDIARWSTDSRLGMCVVGRSVKAIDIDVDDRARAREIEEFIAMGLGSLPTRRRANSGKCLLAFRLPMDFPKRVIRTPHGIIELLSSKQQFVACGTHKSGARIEWDGGPPDSIPDVTMAELDVLWSALVDVFGIDGSTTAKPAYAQRAPARVDEHDAEGDWYRENWECDDSKPDGRFAVRCPNHDHHSPGGAEWAEYTPAWVKGQGHAGFHCLHAGCAHLTIHQFRAATGYAEVLAQTDFDVVVLDDEQSQAAGEALSHNELKAAQHRPIEVVDEETGEVVEIYAPAFSDDRIALQFAAQAAPAFRMSPGMGWMVNDGEVWRRDDHLRRYDLARAVCRQVAKLADRTAEQKALASSRAVNAVVSLAQSDARLMVPVAAWDSEPLLLNTPGGVVDLRTGVLRPRRADLVTRCVRVTPDSGVGCPAWLAFLDGAFQGDAATIGFVQRMLGYSLTGDRREQKLFFFWGEGSNGKSTLADLVLWLLGTYALKLSSAVLMQSAQEKHPTELAQLQGIRLAMSSELEEGAFFNESRVKELTGDATLSARFMRGDFFEFGMTHKHLIVGNHRPRLRGGDPAMARRLVLVPFRAVFPEGTQDKALPDKLRAEGPAILAWLIEGALEWQRIGLAIPPAVQAASSDYLANHDDVQLWLDERCKMDPLHTERAGALYADYSSWKLSRGEKPPSMTVWGDRMALKPGIGKRRSMGIRYTGLGMLPTAPISSDEFT